MRPVSSGPAGQVRMPHHVAAAGLLVQRGAPDGALVPGLVQQGLHAGGLPHVHQRQVRHGGGAVRVVGDLRGGGVGGVRGRGERRMELV